jgi:hypothetical protein
MKRTFLPFLAAICLVTACTNNTTEGAINESANTTTETTTNKIGSKVEDGPAIATIETETYVMKIHKVIPFMPDITKTAGAFTPKEGNQYIALDLSVRSKSDKPFSMGNIVLASNIIDDKGNKYGDLMGSMVAFNLTFPEQENQSESEAIWSTEFAPKEFHRSIALAFEAPRDVKNFTFSAPVSDDIMKPEKKQAQFSLK